MINILLAYDDDENDYLGEFCRQCYYRLTQYFQHKENCKIIELDNNVLKKEHIENAISALDGNPFIFLAYSHGEKGCLNGIDDYVDIQNCYFFNNSFFYTFSCSSGKELGERLITNGCHSFIGYDKVVYIIKSQESYFADCANYGIIRFLEGETSENALNRMLDNYELVIDKLIGERGIGFPVIAELVQNKNALVLLGRDNLSVGEFNILD
jgi:hypothetical protein